MRPAHLAVIARQELRLVRRDPVVVILLVILPLMLAAVLGDGVAGLVSRSGATVTPVGADFVIPGYALLFGFFQVSFVAASFMNEHAWGTWSRLRASSLTAGELLAGKGVPYAGVSVVQLVSLLVVGRIAFDMHLTGSLVAAALVIASTVAFII